MDQRYIDQQMLSNWDTFLNGTLKSGKVIEQSPLDAQVLDEKLLNAVTVAGASTQVYTLDKGRLTFIVYASGTPNFTIACQGSPEGTNYGACGLRAADGTVAASVTITSAGLYIYEVVGTPKYTKANITSYTSGTVSAWMQGGAI